MQSTKKLTQVLKDLVALIEDEAQRNPVFAERLEAITSDLSVSAKKSGEKKAHPVAQIEVPDVLAVFQERGAEELGFWLRTFDLQTLKVVIKQNGFDPGKVATRWTDKDKFVALIVEQTLARLKRGTAFLPAKAEPSES